MYNSKLWAAQGEAAGTKGEFYTVPEDRPLLVQFCGDDPEKLLIAGKMVQDRCDAVDINLGCPQGIARTGHYGSFLLEEPELLERIVKKLHENLTVPVTAKIRLLPNLDDTISLAKRLEAAGISMLAVHGRLREQNKQFVGTCDWEAVSKIKKVMTIPVVLNGGIGSYEDYERCLQETGVDGVMSSEAILENPALFNRNLCPEENVYVDQNRLALEYLDTCDKYGLKGAGSGVKCVRAHMFKYLTHGLKANKDLLERMAQAKDLHEIRKVVLELQERGWEQPWHHGDTSKGAAQKPAPERSWYCRYRISNAGGSSKKLEQAELKRGRSEGGVAGADGAEPPSKAPKVKAGPKTGICNICSTEFPSRSQMFKHIRAAHPETMNVDIPAAKDKAE